jgi:hypothetical protein
MVKKYLGFAIRLICTSLQHEVGLEPESKNETPKKKNFGG